MYSGPYEPMSLPPPPKRKPFFGPTLIGACTGMILCIPLAAYTAAALGNDYNMRAIIYCSFLLWCIVGAVTLFMKTWQSEHQRISLPRCLLWSVSLWVWPLLLLPSLFKKRQ